MCKRCLVFTGKQKCPPSWMPTQIMESLAGQRQPFLDWLSHALQNIACPSEGRCLLQASWQPPANFQSTSWGGVTTPPFNSHHSRNPRDLLHPERLTCWDAGQGGGEEWWCGVISHPLTHSTLVCAYACSGWVLGTQGWAEPDTAPAFMGFPRPAL